MLNWNDRHDVQRYRQHRLSDSPRPLQPWTTLPLCLWKERHAMTRTKKFIKWGKGSGTCLCKPNRLCVGYVLFNGHTIFMQRTMRWKPSQSNFLFESKSASRLISNSASTKIVATLQNSFSHEYKNIPTAYNQQDAWPSQNLQAPPWKNDSLLHKDS